MTILLVRHGRAGRRDRWKGDDLLRPLTKRGRVQADSLVTTLAPWLPGPTGSLFVSSAWTRCIQTLEPAARACGADIVVDDLLSEGAGRKARDALVGWLGPRTTVLCTHGDVVDEILVSLADQGVDVGPLFHAPKGSVWVLDGDTSVHAARYLPPPPPVSSPPPASSKPG
jgi:broad specificity phosphatase PhoE